MDPSSSADMEDPSMYMSPAEVMAMFNDGGVDMSSLFQPATDYPLSQQSPEGASYGAGTPFRNADGIGNIDDNKMLGLVSSP